MMQSTRLRLERRRRAVLQLLLAAALGLAASACASRGPESPAIVLRWPEPPDPPRIEFQSIISSGRDLTGPPGLGASFAEFIGMDSDADLRKIVQPADIAVNGDGSVVYVSDFAQGIIHIFDRGQGDVRYLGVDAPFARPFGIAVDSGGNLYVAEQDLKQVRVLDPQGKTIRIFRDERLIRPVDIALDEARGKLYVADGSHQRSPDHYVRTFDLQGNYLGEVGEGRGTAEGRLLFPTYLAVEPESGDVYISDTMNSRVSVFDGEGRFLRTVGARGDGFGLFDKPKGVALDAFGNLYVVDSSWSNVQIFGPKGDVLLYFGGRGAYPGLLRNPTGIAIARENNQIFVGDYLNRRLVIYQLVNTDADDGLPADPGDTAQAAP